MLEGAVSYVKANRNIVIIGVIAISVACYFMFSGGISNNGGGIDRIQSELAADQNTSQSITNGLGTIEQGIDNSLESVGRIESRNQSIENSVTTVIERNKTDQNRLLTIDELITRNEQINDGVRERGKTGD